LSQEERLSPQESGQADEINGAMRDIQQGGDLAGGNLSLSCASER